ncbi:hypothetical protein BaRGS_00006394 [Batillaria attramentaria]|uniref:Uncharacterized protein n=1 Tax=Batillaria attramentaria TaxID=370345 RepID=A0ABD0LTP9_9CAEN
MVNLDRITHVLKDAIKSIVHRTTDDETSQIIETDFEHDKFKDKLESRDPGMNSYGTFTNTTEFQQFQAMKEQLCKTLYASCEKRLECFVDISPHQLDHLAQDMVRMSQSEPCGLRGAIIFLVLQRKNMCQKLATITGDPSTTPTFAVYVTLREDTSRWRALRKAYLTLKECLLNGAWKESPIVLCSGFQLEKKRLYRPCMASQ